MRTRLPLLLVAVLLPLACRSAPEVDAATARAHLEAAEQDAAAGRLGDAIDRLVRLRRSTGLDPGLRARTEDLLSSTTRRAVAGNLSSGELEDLYERDLGPRLRALAGIAAAEAKLAEGKPLGAFKQVKRVERALPSHPERARAGEVLADAGLEMARRGGHYKLVFSYEARGREALEFLVLNYPFSPRCPQAYAELIRLYGKRKDYDSAIERAEDLLIYHPSSPEAVLAQADLPELRLARLERTDYDRAELEEAESELELWLERYGDHEERPRVEETLRRCRQRLVESDLVVAHFYDTVDVPYGARLHAERALETALLIDAGDLAEKARSLLEKNPAPAEAAP